MAASFPHPARARNLLFLLGAFLPGVFLAGCSPDSSPRKAVHRFVDPEHLAGATMDFGSSWSPPDPSTVNSDHSAFPVAAIGNDSRTVLASPPYVIVSSQSGISAPENLRLPMAPPVPPALLGTEAVLLMPSVRIGALWSELQPVVTKPVQQNGMLRLAVTLELPESARGQSLVVNLYGYGLAWGRETRIESRPVKIPVHATLEFAVGLSNPAKRSGSVVQQVEACTKGKCEEIFRVKTEASPDAVSDWKDVRVDLTSLANREVSFVFRSESGDHDLLPAVFPLWGHPTVYATQADPAPAPVTNVVLISLDTLAAKHLDLYGYPLPTAPKLRSRIEKSGTVFENCVSMATATAPSHMTMLTSVYPLEHGLTDGMSVAEAKATTAAEALRASGMTTVAYTEDGWLSVAHGFGRGFDQFLEDRSPDVMAPVGRVEDTFGRGRAWMAANREKSFFLFLHTFQVHDPYAPAAPYDSLFTDSRLPSDEGVPADVVRERIAYDQEIRYLDDQLDLLLQDIDKLGLADKTLVILTSDHGEAFGEHGYLLHGNHPHEEVLHVLLAMQGPGVPRGRRVSANVGHVDFLPTILEAVGLRAPHPGLRGESLLPLLTATAPSPTAARPLFSESWGTFALTTSRELVPFLPPALSVRLGHRKMTRYPLEGGAYRYEAYDLASDPHEQTDLAPSGSPEVAEMRKLLDDYEEGARQGLLALRGGSSGQAVAPVVLPADQEEKLRALGYIQ
jgi:arylsulfatase A-like enzyme